MNRRAIGIFDSGVGGLTVFRAVQRLMPRENLLYFGDTAHLPYGAKSKAAVTRFSLNIARFLISRKVKFLVVACNTASAWALDCLKESIQVPVVGVIEPGARIASQATLNRVVGIIGTEGTIQSASYPEALYRFDPKIRAVSAACPLLVPLVEEGWWNRKITLEIARGYVRPLKKTGMDTLILGCTHYPILKPVLLKVVGPKVKLVDSAEAVSLEVESLLRQTRLKNDSRGKPVYKFFASDAPDRFLKLARRFVPFSISKVEIVKFE